MVPDTILLYTLIIIGFFLLFFPLIVRKHIFRYSYRIIISLCIVIPGIVLMQQRGLYSACITMLFLSEILSVGFVLVWAWEPCESIISSEFSVILLSLVFFIGALIQKLPVMLDGLFLRFDIPIMMGLTLNLNVFRIIYYGRFSRSEEFIVLPTIQIVLVTWGALIAFLFGMGTIFHYISKRIYTTLQQEPQYVN